MKRGMFLKTLTLMFVGVILLSACFADKPEKSQSDNNHTSVINDTENDGGLKATEDSIGEVGKIPVNSSSEYNFNVGVGKVNVTPDEPLPALMGGSSPLPARFVDTPLFVKAVVIEAENQKVAMVTLDILKYPSDKTDLAAKEIEKETGIPIDNITITASHTHSGPLYHHYIDNWGRDALIQAIVDAVKAADQDLTPSKIGWSETELSDIAHNRRLLIDGEAWNDWLVRPPIDKDTLTPAGPIDPALQVIAAVGADGKMKAILWNYASHPNGSVAPAISADFPGYVQAYVNEKLGYDTTTLFFPGASGDINPNGTPGAVGRRITSKLIDSLDNLKFVSQSKIYVDQRTLQIPGRENPEFAEEDIAKKWPNMVENYRESFQSTLLTARATYETHLTGMKIGDDFAIVTVPGEMFVSLGLDMKNDSSVKPVMVVQQTNGALGYIPAAKDFDLKGYETWYGEHSNLSVNAGEMIKDEILDILNHLQNQE